MKTGSPWNWQNRLATALTVALPLAVMLLSAVYQLAVGMGGYTLTAGLPLMMGILTLLALTAATVLGTLWDRPFVPACFALIFWLCFFGYLAVTLNGTTDLLDDRFFEAITMIFVLPLTSYASVSGLFGDGTVATAVITGLLAAGNTGALIGLAVKRRREYSHE